MRIESRVALWCSALAMGCAGELLSSNSAGPAAGTITWSPDVRFPERDPAFVSAQGMDTQQLILSFSSMPQSLIVPGDIVMGYFGGGYLRRINRIEWTDDRTAVLETTGAELTDAIIEMNAHLDTTAIDDEFHPGPADGVSGSASALTATADFALGQYLSAAFANEIDFEDSHISFDPEVTVDLVIADRRMEVFDVTIEACATIRVVTSLTAAGTLNLGQSVTIPTPFPPIPVTIGPIPATLEIKATAGAELSLSSSGSLRAGGEITGCITVGAHYDPDTEQLIPTGSGTVEATTIGPEIELTHGASLRLSVGPKATLYFFGVAGPFAGVSPYVRFGATPGTTGIDWTLNGGVSASIGLEARVPPILNPLRNLRVSHSFPLYDRVLASGTLPGACVPQCSGLECGDDGCGGSCGSCGAGATCRSGRCESISMCATEGTLCRSGGAPSRPLCCSGLVCSPTPDSGDWQCERPACGGAPYCTDRYGGTVCEGDRGAIACGSPGDRLCTCDCSSGTCRLAAPCVPGCI